MQGLISKKSDNYDILTYNLIHFNYSSFNLVCFNYVKSVKNDPSDSNCGNLCIVLLERIILFEIYIINHEFILLIMCLDIFYIYYKIIIIYKF